MGPETWEVVLYRRSNGECPSAEFILSLSPKDQKRVRAKFDLLRQYGPFLSEEHVKKLVDEIWELRVHLQSGICRFTFFSLPGRIVVITHGFHKKGQKTPRQEIAKALEFRGDYLTRSQR